MHLIKPRSMKLYSFISRLQELNAYLAEFPYDTEGQETVPLPTDEIMDTIYHSMPTTWKNNIIATGFIYADSTVKERTDYFKTRVENLEPKEDKKNLLQVPKNLRTRTQQQKTEKSRLQLQYCRVQ